MNKHELNEIIERDHKNSVPIGDLCYPEAEEMYLNASGKLTKADVATIWHNYDYAGIRNVLELQDCFAEFANDTAGNVLKGLRTRVSTSQRMYLEMIGYDVELMVEAVEPWAGKAGRRGERERDGWAA